MARRSRSIGAALIVTLGCLSCAPEPGGPELEAVVQDNGTVNPEFTTTPEMRRGLSIDYARADSLVAALEDSIYARLGDSLTFRRQDVRDSWVAYRALECDNLKALYEGGTLAPVTELECLVMITKARREFLYTNYGFIGAIRVMAGADQTR
jgi:hypothetical protein